MTTTKRSYSFQDEARALLDDEVVSDVCFLVGDDRTKIHANRNILAVGSDVFRRMFYGEMKEAAFQIEIPDCSPVGLMNVFRYIYGEELKFELIDLYETLIAGDKYLVHHFIEAALEYVERRLSVSNCCLIYDQLLRLPYQPLVLRRTEKLIEQHTGEAFSSGCFGQIDQHTLITILDLPRLSAKEIDIVKFCSRWVDARVEQLELLASRENRQTIFAPIKHFILFDKIPPADIAKCKEITGLLTDDEIVELSRRPPSEPVSFDCLTNRVAFSNKTAQPKASVQLNQPTENRRITRSMSAQIDLDLPRPPPRPFRLPPDEPAPCSLSACLVKMIFGNSECIMLSNFSDSISEFSVNRCFSMVDPKV